MKQLQTVTSYEEHKRAREITLQKDVYDNILTKN